jgi:mRNA interferase HigB
MRKKIYKILRKNEQNKNLVPRLGTLYIHVYTQVMRVIAWSSLVAFYAAHPDAKAALTHWYGIVKAAEWSSMNDVKAAFSNAVVLNGERARFEIAGGRYRLIVAFKFRSSKIAFVKFVGTHKEYDAVDALTVSRY